MTTVIEPLTISVQQACAMTGLGRSKVYELLAEGQLKRVKIGRRTLITTASIRKLVA